MNQHAEKTAITPTRKENYPEWYQQIMKAADLAENSPVRGCMVIKPWGYGIWEKMQQRLDERIKATGHENAYFPLFIPLSYLEKEASQVDGFAKECAIVTHHRLEAKDGKLVPAGELEEPLIVRPTSETIIGTSFSKWIQSHRDLPLLINQWANVVRWEMRTRLFLRTAEFLWQEGHTAHANPTEAHEETLKMLGEYERFVREYLAIPVIVGTKTPSEKFPGAEETYTIEGMMQDRKALQMGTSHYLGQTFSKAFDIKFTNHAGEIEYAYTTSWGITTRLIGGLVMVHSDDNGLRLPPKVAPKHIVIIPYITKPEFAEKITAHVESFAEELRTISYHGKQIEVVVDKRDMRGGEKNWHWVKKGIPLRIEIGARDIENGTITFARRDQDPKEKNSISPNEFKAQVVSILEAMQENYLQQALAHREEHTHTNISSYKEMEAFFSCSNEEQPEIHGGFVRAKWCGDAKCEEKIKELKVTIRCLPLDQSKTAGSCAVCGCEGHLDAIYAKSY